jgi:hypothetical protein
VTQQEFFEYVVRALEAAGVPYMITGSVAAMVYGEPRLTNDIDVVVALAPRHLEPLLNAFAVDDFYVPPADVIRDEMHRRGQFNIIHVASGSKVDLILRKDTAFAREEFSRRQQIQLTTTTESQSATPEDVIIAKLEYYRLGQSEKHLRDIQAILRLMGPSLDWKYIDLWTTRLGLTGEWSAARAQAERDTS